MHVSEFFMTVQSIAIVLFCMVMIWIFGRMGDNVNKIRKLLEQEIRKSRPS
jgi:flagellar biogenesis protein FliO